MLDAALTQARTTINVGPEFALILLNSRASTWRPAVGSRRSQSELAVRARGADVAG